MLGDKIKNYLNSHGIKQAFIVQNTDLNANQVSDICIKDRKVDAIEYYQICKALELPLDYFFREED